MTDPSIKHLRRQAAELGPAMALRQQNPASPRERLIQRPRPAAASLDGTDEWAELARRRRELERNLSKGNSGSGEQLLLIG